MTLENDAKFKEKLTCGFKYDIKDLMNFHPTTQKFKNFTFDGLFLSKVYEVWAKKNTREFAFTTGNRNAKFEWTLTLWFQKWHKELGELSLERSKVWKIVHWWALFVQSISFSWTFQRNSVSWHWRAMQNLNENWHDMWLQKWLKEFA